jgi:hypothetical protein
MVGAGLGSSSFPQPDKDTIAANAAMLTRLNNFFIIDFNLFFWNNNNCKKLCS